MPKTKKYLPFPVFLLIAAVVSFSAWQVIKIYGPQAKPLTINEIAPSGGTVSLSLTPASVEVTPNTDTTISLMVDSGSDRLTIVDFEIDYDASKLTLTSPTVGTWLTKQISAVTVGDGKIKGTIGAQPDGSTTGGGAELNRTGSGTLLTFKVKGSTVGSYPITINPTPTTTWTVTGDTANEGSKLKSVTNTTITISNPKLVTDIVGTSRIVDKYDYVELINQYGKLPAGSADFNTSGAVDAADYNRLISDYGKTW
jgi:hypothetical protein